MSINKGALAAQKILEEFGIENPNDFSVEDLIHARSEEHTSELQSH